MQTGADLFAASLAAGGVDTVYALPGEETSALMDALEKTGIAIVLCRHEQAAAYMASVHGRLTGAPGVCLATLGPGATNLVTGVADAQLDRAPLLAITGQGARDRLARGADSHQVIDLARLFEPVTKLSRRLDHGAEVPGAVAEALRMATAPRPGAVHLSLPEDLAGAAVDGAPLPAMAHRPMLASPEACADAVSRLSTAERPIILAGAGVLRAGAASTFRDFADSTGLPVATSFMAKGLLPPEHPQNLGAFGLPRPDHVDKAIAAADLILAVGYDPVEFPLETLTQQGDIPVVSVSETPLPRDVGWAYVCEVTGDLEPSLRSLGSGLQTRRWPVWPEASVARDALRDDWAKADTSLDDARPSAQVLTAALRQNLKDTDLVYSGVGTHKLALARDLPARSPGQITIANGLAGMGLALPGAIAAARLRPDTRVLAVCGDGDIMMNVQEMETATRLDVSLTVVVWIDGGYGLIEDKQEDTTGRRPDLSFHDIDWPHLAATFGWTHTDCETAADLAAALGDPAQRETPRHLITVPVRYSGDLA